MKLLGYVIVDDDGNLIRKARGEQWNRPATTGPASIYEDKGVADRMATRFGGRSMKVYIQG